VEGEKPRLRRRRAPGDVDPFSLGGKVYFFKGKDISSAVTLASSTAFAATGRSQGFGSALAVAQKGRLLIGAPRVDGDTGSVSMVDLSTGQSVPGGSSGGPAGEECHD